MTMFNKVSIRRNKYNKFNLSHERKLSCHMAKLIPINCVEIVPGDKFRVGVESLIRLAPMKAPIMHRMNVTVHHFFVPNRIIYDGWETFITGGEDGKQEVNFPKINFTDADSAFLAKGSLADYLGIATMVPTSTLYQSTPVSALPFRAYTEIWNEYYRDQNLQSAIEYDKGETDITSQELANIAELRTRAWEKDYFTSSLPWTQRGDDVMLPIDSVYNPQYRDQTVSRLEGLATLSPLGDAFIGNDGSVTAGTVIDGSPDVPIWLEGLEQDQMIDASSVTVNELRTAVKLQEWLERNARAGSRYVEQILSHFGVKSSDARLQRPEYLGGSVNPIQISEVLNTVGEVGGAPQGDMTGHGITYNKANGFKRRFEEHGILMSLMSITPKTAYQQGIPRQYQKFDRYDYYWPEFAHLGEQDVKMSELYFKWDAQYVPSDTFGYQARYAEYKQAQSQVAGDFRDTLDFWHLGRQFSEEPVLNASFITADPSKRIFAVTDETEHELWCQIYNQVSALRLMPYFGTPRL